VPAQKQARETLALPPRGTPQDTEFDECDDEPSLGSHVLPSGAVSYFMPVGRDGSHDCEGDEIDSEVDDAPV
jgi:hypothetical protein